MVWDKTVTACLCAIPEGKVSQMAKEKENRKRNSDVVKKINLKDNPFYLVSLIEHKSDVDYNVAYEKTRSCQVLRKRRWKSWSKNTASRKKRRRKRSRCTGKI